MKRLFGVVEASLLAARALGFRAVAREAWRRLAGVPYAYRGVEVADSETFRVLRLLAARGEVWGDGEHVYFRTSYGVFSAPRGWLHLLRPLAAEDFEAMYGFLDVRGRVVADVGAYIGETAVLFAKRGARRVVAYEPVFWRLLERNVQLNQLSDAVEVRRHGVWLENATLYTMNAGATTGLVDGLLPIEVRRADFWCAHVVKMDCEGCEWLLAASDCGTLKTVQEYVVEIHGPEPYIVSKMRRCGFAARRLNWPSESMLSLWHFYL